MRKQADMVRLDGGRFFMGSDTHYPEEKPLREVEVDGFWIDRHMVTNADFARFVRRTKYVTLAERRPIPKIIPALCLKCSNRPALCLR